MKLILSVLIFAIIVLKQVTTLDIVKSENVLSRIRDRVIFGSNKDEQGSQMPIRTLGGRLLNKLKSRNSSYDNLSNEAGLLINNEDVVTDLIEDAGYPSETHQLRTSDDYILKIYRIPPTLRRKNKVVFLMHGMLSSAADYVATGPNHSLAYTLAEAGYDVWLGNARGNTFSRRHVNLSTRSKDFWDFSWHEIGMIDLPEMIDYVLNYTNKEALHYVGHSQGTTSFFVMLSMRPEYNKKILTAHMMSPVAFISHIKSAIVRNFIDEMETLEFVSKRSGIYEIFPNSRLSTVVTSTFCSDLITKKFCGNILDDLTGSHLDGLNRTSLYEVFRNFPAGSSTKQAVHYGQVSKSQRFQLFDYKADNYRVYNAAQPPEYPLQNIRVPISIFYATKDNLLSVRDATRLINALAPTTTAVIKLKDWGHLDFIIAKDAKTEIYSKIHAMIDDFVE